jgi:hypothetical protein
VTYKHQQLRIHQPRCRHIRRRTRQAFHLQQAHRYNGQQAQQAHRRCALTQLGVLHAAARFQRFVILLDDPAVPVPKRAFDSLDQVILQASECYLYF